MEHPDKLTSFQREYLWELEIPRKQVLALAEAIPEEAYSWRPAEDARTFSAVLVHIAAAHLMLLWRADVVLPDVMEFCGAIEGEGLAQWVATAHKGLATEKSLTAKPAILDLLRRSFECVREALVTTSEADLEQERDFGTEISTYRRVYLRILCHAHEHMGQAVAYARALGYPVPWPDPVKVLEQMAAQTSAPA